jgi:hypothetical protein
MQSFQLIIYAAISLALMLPELLEMFKGISNLNSIKQLHVLP